MVVKSALSGMKIVWGHYALEEVRFEVRSRGGHRKVRRDVREVRSSQVFVISVHIPYASTVGSFPYTIFYRKRN